MARNRKSQDGGVRLVPVLKACLLCLLLGGTAAGYVIQKNKIYELGRQITAREEQLAQLKWHNKLRASQLADTLLPQRLAERVQQLNLGLVPPQPGRIIWLPEPGLPAPTNRPAQVVILKP